MAAPTLLDQSQHMSADQQWPACDGTQATDAMRLYATGIQSHSQARAVQPSTLVNPMRTVMAATMDL